MHFYYSMDEWELYDLENDPLEMDNIYSTASDSLILSLKATLKDLQKEFKDDAGMDEMKQMTDTVIARVYNEPRKSL